MIPGDVVRIDFPGHALHGKAAEVVEFYPAFNLAPSDDDPLLAPLVIVRHPSLPEPFGIGLSRIVGTAQHVERRRAEADDARQEELVL